MLSNRCRPFAFSDNAQTQLRYDGAGRLREVAEYNYWGGLTVTRYAWNGWLPIAELDGSNRIVRTFTWGLDVSGIVGGAGGIGGLVGIRDRAGSGTNYFVRTDGKGNVIEVRTSAGTVVASYRYAPFGTLLTSSGTYNQPFRFQSKIWHGPSGLGYWDLRWYDLSVGRWISRDGLGEAGGMNLYEYCFSAPLGMYDPFGLARRDMNARQLAIMRHMIADVKNAGHQSLADKLQSKMQNGEIFFETALTSDVLGQVTRLRNSQNIMLNESYYPSECSGEAYGMMENVLLHEYTLESPVL